MVWNIWLIYLNGIDFHQIASKFEWLLFDKWDLINDFDISVKHYISNAVFHPDEFVSVFEWNRISKLKHIRWASVFSSLQKYSAAVAWLWLLERWDQRRFDSKTKMLRILCEAMQFGFFDCYFHSNCNKNRREALQKKERNSTNFYLITKHGLCLLRLRTNERKKNRKHVKE